MHPVPSNTILITLGVIFKVELRSEKKKKMNLSCLLVLNMSRQTQEMCERQQYCISSGRWAGGVNRALPSLYCRTVVIHHFYSAINYMALCSTEAVLASLK